jgi:ferric-dicitrate binding protein FerR (iron transport regulator)
MNEREQLSDRSVEQLLRIASEQPPVPADAAARVREAVYQAWQQDVAKRRFRRRVVTMSSLAAAAAIALVFVLVPRGAIAPQRVAAKLERNVGTVHVRALAAGTEIVTGADGRASFRLDSGTEFRLDRDSRVVVGDGAKFTLDSGAIYVASAEPGIEVRTRFGATRDIGTRFEVRLQGGRELVRVRDGIVEFESHRAVAGEQLEVSAAGVSKSALATYAGEWDWTGSIAPPFAIEGGSVASFLAWVSSETGMNVRYESNELRARAHRTTLHGTMGELTPAAACGAILPTAGMRCGARDGVLTITDGAP